MVAKKNPELQNEEERRLAMLRYEVESRMVKEPQPERMQEYVPETAEIEESQKEKPKRAPRWPSLGMIPHPVHIDPDAGIGKPPPCPQRIMSSLLFGAFNGFFVSFISVAWYPEQFGAVIRRGGGYLTNQQIKEIIKPKPGANFFRAAGVPFVWMTMCCTLFSVVDCTVESFRADETRFVSTGIAGGVTGFVAGALTRRLDVMATMGLGVGIVSAASTWNNFNIHSGNDRFKIKDPLDDPDSKEVLALKAKYPEYKHL